MSLIANTDLKTYLGIPPAETVDDTPLTNACSRAQGEAEVYCKRHFEKATYTDEKHNGNGTSKLIPNEGPIVSVTSLYDDLDREFTADDLIASADYVIKRSEGIIELDGLIFSEGLDNIKITYVAGYGQSSPTPLANEVAVPDDLKQALIYLASAIYLEGKQGVNATPGNEAVYRPDKLRKEAYKILDRYIRYGTER